jgi:chemotaxis methyl-accepting protein methylase
MAQAASEGPDPEFEALIRHIQQSRGVDFRGYKRTSLRRRITKRMEEVGVESFAAYHAFLEAHPQEFVELLNTVLINVTSFFRDTEAWDVLRDEVIPRLLRRERPAQDQVRVWSVGCASGEEPYSLAILFAEALGAAEFCQRVKIYATDLDEAALSVARHASYAPREVESVPPELLEKYFERTNNHYVVSRELRKCVIFGRHNVVHDAPISRIDLLVCRNLLIYLESETQDQVLPRLHYALADDGVLFLGKAETQLARSKLFQPVELKHRIFRKVPQEWRRSPGGQPDVRRLQPRRAADRPRPDDADAAAGGDGRHHAARAPRRGHRGHARLRQCGRAPDARGGRGRHRPPLPGPLRLLPPGRAAQPDRGGGARRPYDPPGAPGLPPPARRPGAADHRRHAALRPRRQAVRDADLLL